MEKLLTNPIVFSTLVSGITWLVNKALGKRADAKAAKVTMALATASALMLQYAMTEPNKTPAEVITACKGFVAVQLAKAQVWDTGPYQLLIDAAISAGVTEWVKRHPSPSSLTMPATAKVAA